MKKLMFASLVFCFITSCNDDKTILQPTEQAKPIVMSVFCQSAPFDTISRVDYEYQNGRLITETSAGPYGLQSKRVFVYNADNLLTNEIYTSTQRRTEMTYQYNDTDQLINVTYRFIAYDTSGTIQGDRTVEAPLEYENNLLVKEWAYFGGFSTYEYQDGKISAITYYEKYGNKNSVIKFKYSGLLKIEERKEAADGDFVYIRTYQYDSQNRLVKVIEDGDIIEENTYTDNKLIERKLFYFGMDPGIDICYGNYIYRYEY